MTLKTMAAATAADTTCDPTRWGSAEVAEYFPEDAAVLLASELEPWAKTVTSANVKAEG